MASDAGMLRHCRGDRCAAPQHACSAAAASAVAAISQYTD